MSESGANGNATTRRGVCIVGFANSKDKTPWDRPNTDFVFLNELHQWLGKVRAERTAKGLETPNYKVWFELHTDEQIGPCGQPNRPDAQAHWDWLAAQPVNPQKPIYMQRAHPKVPNSVAFPLHDLYKRIAAHVPALAKRPVYLTSSIGMMLMWAMCEGRDASFVPDGSGTHYEWLGLYGIDLAGDSEYQYQRPNAEFFAGIAAGLGIEIDVPPEASLFRGECVYGYEQPPEASGPLTRVFFEAQVGNIKRELAKNHEIVNKHAAIINTLNGALQAQESNLKMLTDYVKRGIGPANLVNATELMTVAEVKRG